MRANKSGADRSPKTEATELEFREALGRFATGVTIVTVRGSGGRPYGLTVNAFSSLSLQPLLVLICLDNSLTEIDSFTAGRLFGVNILSREQEDLSRHFAAAGSDRSRAHYREGRPGFRSWKAPAPVWSAGSGKSFRGEITPSWWAKWRASPWPRRKVSPCCSMKAATAAWLRRRIRPVTMPDQAPGVARSRGRGLLILGLKRGLFLGHTALPPMDRGEHDVTACFEGNQRAGTRSGL